GRGLLLQRFGEVIGALTQLVEQPRVLDRDHRLGGEVRHQVNLLASKRPYFLLIDADGSDQSSFLEHGHDDKGTDAGQLDPRDHECVAPGVSCFRFEIGDLNRLHCFDETSKRAFGSRRTWPAPPELRKLAWDVVQRAGSKTVLLAKP